MEPFNQTSRSPVWCIRWIQTALLAAVVCILPSVVQAQTWNAFNDFYVNVPATGGNNGYNQVTWIANGGKTNSNAWGYAGGNFNGGSFPATVGTYITTGLYPLTAGGDFAGPGASYDLGGGHYWIGYNDNYAAAGIGLPNAQTQIGKYTKEWFNQSPNWTNNPSGINSKYLWIQPTGLAASTDGLGAILTWTAPASGTFQITGSYVNGNYGQSTSFAIVDSKGETLLSRQLLAPASTHEATYSFTRNYSAGDVIQFQVGTPAAAQGSPLGLAVNIVQITTTNWNATRDFYLSPTAAGWTGSTTPNEAGTAWGYYMGNVNGGGFPASIGTYLPSSQIYKYSNHNPLGAGGPVYSTSEYAATGGAGFAYYKDNLPWGTSLGFFDSPWSSPDGFRAPGNTTEPKAGIWMQATQLVPGSTQFEGIASVVTWTAPYSGIYDFKTSFQVGNNGTTNGASIAIVANTGSALLSRTNLTRSMDYFFAFRRTLNQGDVIQFQVGSDFNVAAPVALNADVTRVGDVNQKVPSSVNLAESGTLAYTGSGVSPALAILGSTTAPTYSYKGVDGTSYGPSSNAPTARGRYEVTVTTADDANWSGTTNKFYYSVGTFNAFKDFWWNRTNGRSAWTDAAQALAQGRSQGTPTAKNAWNYGFFNCTNKIITDSDVNTTFQALPGYSHDSSSPSWTYHNGDTSGTRVSWIAANSNNAVLVLAPSAGVAGGDGLAAAVRWTAPAAGTYRFQGRFVSQGSDSMSVAIQTYGGDEGNVVTDAVYLARTNVAAGATQAFDFFDYIEANQTVTWVVGSDGASTGDVMLLSANVHDVAGGSLQTPTITWTNPVAITYGTALSGAQLNATSSSPGTFVYNPTSGTILNVGTNTLTVVFTPSDLATYNSTTNTVSLLVNPVAPSEPSFETTYDPGTENDLGPNGLQNLMNYALGGTGPSSSPALPILASVSNNLTLTANIRNTGQGVAVIGQVAESLDGPWTDVALTATGASSVVTNTTVQSFSAIVETNKPRKFLRLKATK